jgi:hypothetical protein
LQKIRNFSKLVILTLLVFFTLGFSFHSEHGVFAQTDQITLRLQAANNAVGQAFEAVLEAEKAGGNVTQLLIKLNIAGTILADAQNVLNSGITVNITSNVENAFQIANQVNDVALNLRNVSFVRSQNSLWLTLTFSVIGSIAFGISLIIIWRRFKRSYMNKLLDMKPEVIENTP